MADKRIDQLVAATTLGNNDLLVLEQNNQAKKMSGATLASFVYNAAADKIAEVNRAVADAQDAVDSLEEQKNTIAEAIASMADLGTDTTLSTTGMAADAKATGDKIKDAETAALAGLDQAEITGVPIATFDDGADDAPVKALKVAIEPKQDLHGYANPWPAGGNSNKIDEEFEIGGIINASGEPFDTSDRIRTKNFSKCEANTSYYAFNSGNNGSIYWYAEDYSYISYAAAVNQVITSPNNAAWFKYVIGGETTYRNNVAINYPSSVQTYSPYENICPITGWTGANVTRTGKNLFDKNDYPLIHGYFQSGTIVGHPSHFITYVKCKPNTRYTVTRKALTSNERFAVGYSETIPAVGSSVTLLTGGNITTTTGSLIRLPAITAATAKYLVVWAGWNDLSWVDAEMQIEEGDNTSFESSATTYEIAFPLSAGTVYGGTLDVTNGVLTVDWTKITIDAGTNLKNNGKTSNSTHAFITPSPDKKPGNLNVISNIFTINGDTYDWYGKMTGRSSIGGVEVYLPVSVADDTSSVKAWLIEHGTELCYELATPITYTLTPPVVRTLLVLNNIWADTGNILDLIYRRQPISDADIQENIDAIRDAIADREDSGVASKNYTTGSLILIGSNLYEAAGPITTGESLVPGFNCTATTVAAQIAYIKSIINGLGNLAYLSYENA